MNLSREGSWQVCSKRDPSVTAAQPGTRRCPRRCWGQTQPKTLLVAQGCFPPGFQSQQPPSGCSQEHCPSTPSAARQGNAASVSFIPRVPPSYYSEYK